MIATVISIFLLMFAGFIARLAGALRASDADVVRSIVTNITGPAFIFAAIYGKAINRDMIVAPAVHIIALVIVAAAAYALARLLRLDRPTTGALMLVCAFGNTGFLGYPVVAAAFPRDVLAMPAVVMVDQLGETICMYSIGIAIAMAFGSHGNGGFKAALGFLKTPLFLAMALVFAIRLPVVNLIHIPAFIVSPDPTLAKGVINYLADATIPLAMLSLGLTITRVPMKSIAVPFAVACVLKFGAMPLLNLVGLHFTGVGGTVGQVAILEAAMPAAIMTSVVAGRYGSNATFASAAVFLMTLMSIGVIPAVLELVR